MANYARVSLSTGAFKVYSEPERINQIGLMYPGECFTENGFSETDPVHVVLFRTASGTLRQGYIHNSMKLDYFNKWTVSNGKLVANNPVNGYYVHTIKSGYNMNWYIGEAKQTSPLPGGTKLYFSGTAIGASANHPYRIMFNGFKRPTDSAMKKIDFWIDFLTLGSLISNRVIL